jgi:uncharacterized iron-regulated membrane protein
MNYDIHVGAIIGLPGKILMFFASLICASLPITGCYIWWGRRKKKANELEEEEAATVNTTKTVQSFARPVITPARAKSEAKV